jgi:hypothetical protein
LRKAGDATVDFDDLRSFYPQAFSSTVWAYATANSQHPGQFEKIGHAITQFDYLESFLGQSSGRLQTLHGHLLLQMWKLLYYSMMSLLFTKAILDKQNGFSVENLRQLYQLDLWQTKEMKNVDRLKYSKSAAMKHSSERILKYQVFRRIWLQCYQQLG